MVRRTVPAIAFVTLWLVAAAVPAQELTSVTQFGTSSYDEVWGVGVDGTDVYLGGVTRGALSDQVSAGDQDAFVRKVDADGNEVWTREFGTAEYDTGFMVTTDGTGVYIVGITNGTLPGQTALGGQDAYLRKYDANGNELWTRQFGTAEFDFGSNVEANASGVYVVGSTDGALPGQPDRRQRDAFLRRYDANGNEVWTVQFGSGKADFGYANTVDATGVSVVGYTEGQVGGANRGGSDAFVSRFDLDGNLLWSRQIGTRQTEFGYGIVTDATAVYVSGSTDGSLKGQTNRGGFDAFVRAFAIGDGATQWTRQFGTRADDQAPALAIDGAGTYAVGVTDGTLRGQTAAGLTDGFVRALDPTGATRWTLQFGTRKTDYADWAIVDAGSLLVVGGTGGTFPGQTQAGEGDGFLARISLG